VNIAARLTFLRSTNTPHPLAEQLVRGEPADDTNWCWLLERKGQSHNRIADAIRLLKRVSGLSTNSDTDARTSARP
jgi:hypothetical protein